MQVYFIMEPGRLPNFMSANSDFETLNNIDT